MPSVNEFLKKVAASEKFLKSLGALGNFNDIEKAQFKKLETAVAQSRWNEEDTAVAVAAVREASKFSDLHKQALLQQMAKNVSKKEAPKALKGPSVAGQDYSSLHRFLTPGLWQQLQHRDTLHRLHALCSHAAKLGLQQPTEVTLGTMMACVFWPTWSKQMPSRAEKYRLGQGLKPTLRQVWKEYKDKGAANRLEKLPPTFDELPQSHHYIFENEFPVLSIVPVLWYNLNQERS